jgi:nitroimidazol reductase NimA-like FMN-containing flavoprotein (pyridoxamine 5'-phosphate oxidase superfamily)
MTRDRKLVRRQPARGRYDRRSIDAVLDAGLVAHVAFVDSGQPYCIPMMYARVDDAVCVHGSTASRAMKMLATGAPACLTVTLVDGLVLARSAFEHSANYRSAVLVGSFRTVTDEEAKKRAFQAFTNKVIPGRWDEVRSPNPKELRSSMILAMPIDEAAVKVRTGPPSDDDSPDADLPAWAGVVPLVTSFGSPEPSPGLAPGIPLADSVRRIAVRAAPLPDESGEDLSDH